MSGTRLSDKFPGLVPISSPPTLFTINGVGTGLYGSRDHDEETGTYVKTYCLCVIFVPVLALSAYRVAYAGDSSYYFIGKQPLSGVAKAWNGMLALLLLLGGGLWGFQAWYHSPENVAGRQLAAAERKLAAGQQAEAIADLEAVASGPTARAARGREKLAAWLAAPPQGATPQDKLAAWRAAVRLQRSGRWSQSRQSLCDRGLALAAEVAETSSDAALTLLDESAQIDSDPQASQAQRRELLETLHAAHPADVALAVRLATALEAEEELPRAVELLAPHQAALGDTEGARILGQHLAAAGKYDEAYPLLFPYCQSRLARFRAAEEALTAAFQSVQETALERLRNGQGEPGFYERYEAADEQEKQVLVNAYLESVLKNDSQLAALRDALINEGRIVPVALDLGVVQLQRAQSLADPAARKAQLEQAEQTFLAVGNAAGESDAYQLNLGKVYYWLGKQDEGRTLFDAVLARNAGVFAIRYALARVLREVGAEAEARELVEAIYNEESDEANKSAAASLRAVMAREPDDEILWLSRCQQADPDVRASLCLARARKAIEQGDDAQAQTQLRQAVALYEAMPENSSTLNNAAISYNGVFSLAGDPADLRKGAQLLEKSLSLEPDNAILLANTAETFEKLAIAETVADRVDLRLLGMQNHFELLRLCYSDEAGREELLARLRERPALAKALLLYDRAMLLAPKRAANYRQAAELYGYLDDAAALRRIAQRIEEVQPDTSESIEDMKRHLRGEREEEIRLHLARRTNQARTLADRWRPEPASERRSRSLAGALAVEAENILASAAMGQPADLDDAVRLSQQALAEHACAATQRTLLSALVGRASRQLEAENAEYKALAAAGRPAISQFDVVLLALEREPLKKQLAENADLRRAAQLAGQSATRFPTSGSIENALLLAPFDPAAAASERELAKKDEGDRLGRQIDYRLQPASAQAALSLIRWLALEDNPAEAESIRQQMAGHGIVLP